jgi:4-amino-4-deoxy-L-arabinose transferase-like glycosyltransferase
MLTRTWQYILVIFFLATLVHGLPVLLAFHYEPRGFPSDTVDFYDPFAKGILSGKGIVREQATQVEIPEPGYPLFLASVYKVTGQVGMSNTIYPWIVVFIQCVNSILIFFIGKRVAGKTIGLIAGLLFATYPPIVYLSTLSWVSTPLFLLPFFGFVLSFLKAWQDKSKVSMIASGVFLGMAALVRAFVVYLPVFLTIFLWTIRTAPLYRKRILWTVSFLGPFLIVIFPWILYNGVSHGIWVPISPNGPPALLDGLTHLADSEVAQDALPFTEEMRTSALTVGKFWINEFWAKPWVTVKYYGLKISRVWYGTNAGWHEMELILIQIPYLFTALWGLWQAILSERTRRISLLLLTIVIYFWLVTSFALSILRYMIPVMGLLHIFAAIGITDIFRRFKRTSANRTI